MTNINDKSEDVSVSNQNILRNITQYDPTKYEKEQAKANRQQLKLECLRLAMAMIETSAVEIVNRAKEFYKFVRT